ncbi:hypothetical protein [Helicobacter pylori]|nr:hypothetical protein [Helicobacter pylori]
MLCLSELILAMSFLIVDSEGFSPSIYTDIPTRRGIPRLATAII